MNNTDKKKLPENDKNAARKVKQYHNGKKISLADQPLVAYSLACGHLGRDYAIKKGDFLFCTPCAQEVRVAKILAQ